MTALLLHAMVVPARMVLMDIPAVVWPDTLDMIARPTPTTARLPMPAMATVYVPMASMVTLAHAMLDTLAITATPTLTIALLLLAMVMVRVPTLSLDIPALVRPDIPDMIARLM